MYSFPPPPWSSEPSTNVRVKECLEQIKRSLGSIVPTVDSINTALKDLGSVQRLAYDTSDGNLKIGTMERDKMAKHRTVRLSYRLMLPKPKDVGEDPGPPGVTPWPPFDEVRLPQQSYNSLPPSPPPYPPSDFPPVKSDPLPTSRAGQPPFPPAVAASDPTQSACVCVSLVAQGV